MDVKELWNEKAYYYLLRGEYEQAAYLYEAAITTNPSQPKNYWYLGLVHLLQGQEEKAQATWVLAWIELEEKQVVQFSSELLYILEAEAKRRENLEEYQLAWVIRQHAREFFPGDINNLLAIIWLSIEHTKSYTPNDLDHLEIINLLESEPLLSINGELLLIVLDQVLDQLYFERIILRFIRACSHHIASSQAYIDILISAALKFSFIKNQPQVSSQLTEICLEREPKNLRVIQHLASFYQNAGNYSKGIEVSKYYGFLCVALTDKIYACYLLLRGLLSAGGNWEEALKVFEKYFLLLSKLSESQITRFLEIKPEIDIVLFSSTFFLSYFQDNPEVNRLIQNRISFQVCNNVQLCAAQIGKEYNHVLGSKYPQSLKIGFVSHCFHQHSVGWLCRWFFKYYNREEFQTHLYFHAREPENAFSHEFFVRNAWRAYSSANSLELANKVYEDQINVFIDLDSITLDTTCELMAFKPAPIQVTWLGWDASGIPAIDYFMADPYVLPENAQKYYSETIWRLPQTYIAVDGFEVGTPTLRRDQLDISTDAVIYLSAQNGYKRHPDVARLQMEILREVPNSYFLMKGLGDQVAIQQFFMQLAEEEGVNPGRLRFLSRDLNEYIHRANLGIADVVLDTYPYNGATTTLETLWMGIPLVTRVGQQFAARNSYAFMMNVGVTEGIAWTDEEYVEWGVRLGKDTALRQQVAWKLKASRQTSPLWNAKQFTRDMETAFQQMWKNYLDTNCNYT